MPRRRRVLFDYRESQVVNKAESETEHKSFVPGIFFQRGAKMWNLFVDHSLGQLAIVTGATLWTTS
jgi:hypothetical protein